jgi:branched-chain amino acid aminotransferase
MKRFTTLTFTKTSLPKLPQQFIPSCSSAISLQTTSFSRSFGTFNVSETKNKLSNVDASKLSILRTIQPKIQPKKENLKFGAATSDHMLEIDWTHDYGWNAPRIIPYQPLQLDPAASSLHYALQGFEGMKAYIDDKGNMRMFRPDMNMKRLNNTARRLYLPEFDSEQFLKCIEELLKIERNWIPEGKGYSLYIRPTIISTHPFLGVQPALRAKLYVICSPVGPYFPTGFAPVKLYADPHYARAWPGGTGDAKVGANYAMGILPAMQAAKKGFQQILWLSGPERYVTEVGTMNQFFFWVNKDGERELITAPLDGTILPGVTRDSILQLTREWKEFKVTERKYTIDEVIAAAEEGRLLEGFGAGTAAIVSPVNGFNWNGKDYAVPLDKNDPSAKAGPLAKKITETIMDIQYGKISHPWSHIVKA